MWVPTTDLPTTAGHPFYARLNQLLAEHGFDDFVEAQCQRFYARTQGRPGLAPGIYFRLLLIGYFEGLDAERGIAWRAADSLTIRDFLSASRKVSNGGKHDAVCRGPVKGTVAGVGGRGTGRAEKAFRAGDAGGSRVGILRRLVRKGGVALLERFGEREELVVRTVSGGLGRMSRHA